MNKEQSFLIAEDIHKTFRIGTKEIPVLKGVSFAVEKGSWTALLGASGSGKTTLLDILGSISRPDQGTVRVDSIDYTTLSRNNLVKFRRQNIGFVFQAYHILPELNILENVMLPAMMDGMKKSEARLKAGGLLEKVGLAHRLNHRPGEMSGGEQQRCAIARALMNQPRLLLADEPTGNLDSVTGKGILDLFVQLRQETETTIIMVTHDRNVAALADRVVELRDGVIYHPEEETVS